MEAVGRYLVKNGVTPGTKLLDIYSAINTGGVGNYGWLVLAAESALMISRSTTRPLIIRLD
jgi:hypothetical protein